jgi:type II secretory pathway component GspD/PulD (secretin)
MKLLSGMGVFLGLLCVVHAGVVSKVFPLGDADPREVEAAVKSVLSANGKTVLLIKERKLLVQDEADNVTTSEAIVNEFTAPRPNIRVEVMFQEDATSNNRQLEVRGRVGGNDIQVGNAPMSRNSVVIQGNNSRTTQSSSSNQFLVVQSGRTASIRVVQEVPFVDYFYQYALNSGYVVSAETRWRDIGSQMAVTPRVVGSFIDVELMPQITRLVDARTETVDFRELATRVTVANGQTVDVGGFQGATEEFNRNFFSGGGRRSGTGSSGFRLRATVF